jgi:nucleoid-associated protein YgaU
MAQPDTVRCEPDTRSAAPIKTHSPTHDITNNSLTQHTEQRSEEDTLPLMAKRDIDDDPSGKRKDDGEMVTFTLPKWLLFATVAGVVAVMLLGRQLLVRRHQVEIHDMLELHMNDLELAEKDLSKKNQALDELGVMMRHVKDEKSDAEELLVQQSTTKSTATKKLETQLAASEKALVKAQAAAATAATDTAAAKKEAKQATAAAKEAAKATADEVAALTKRVSKHADFEKSFSGSALKTVHRGSFRDMRPGKSIVVVKSTTPLDFVLSVDDRRTDPGYSLEVIRNGVAEPGVTLALFSLLKGQCDKQQTTEKPSVVDVGAAFGQRSAVAVATGCAVLAMEKGFRTYCKY